MPDTEPAVRPSPPPWLFYTIAFILALGSTFSFTLMFTSPGTRWTAGIGVAGLVLASVVVGTTYAVGVIRRLHGRLLMAMAEQHAEQLRSLKEDADERRANIAEMFGHMGTLAYDFRRVVAFAEQGVGVSYGLTAAVEELQKRVDELSAAWSEERLQAISDRLDELTRDFAQSQVAHLHRRGQGRSNGSGESGYS